MAVSREQLRERYSTLPTDDLRRVIWAPPGNYTPEAREVAASILFTRRLEKPEPATPPPTADEKQRDAQWAGLSVLALFLAHHANHVFQMSGTAT